MKTKGPKTQFKSEPENNDAKLLYTLFVGNQPVITYIQFSNALKSFSVQVKDTHFGAIYIDLNMIST
jgi:hypothetical protein